MPFGDGTGPRGMGPMTGWGTGYCTGFNRPGIAGLAYGRSWFGFNRGRGRGMGRGMGMGGGIMPLSTSAPQSSGTEQEIEALKAQSQALAEQLAGIQQRIEELGEKER